MNNHLNQGIFLLIVFTGLLRFGQSSRNGALYKEVRDIVLREIQNLKANVTDELEERIEVLEDTVIVIEQDIEELENEDALINIRLFDIEMDVFDNENAIEDLAGRADTTDTVLLNHTTEINDLSASVNELESTDTVIQLRISALEDTVNAPWVACESSPCINGATCVDVNVDTFICICRDGYFGITCSESYMNTIFVATFSERYVYPGDPVIFDEVRINGGENYNPTTGIYTVPVNGLYEFHAQIYIYIDESYTWAFYISVDGTYVTDSAHVDTDVLYDSISSTATVILSLSQGQQVTVRPYNLLSLVGSHADEDDRMNSWFGGRLIMAT